MIVGKQIIRINLFPTDAFCELITHSLSTMIFQHDAELDYYGKRLATCSSDKTIRIFEVDGETKRLVETLKGYG